MKHRNYYSQPPKEYKSSKYHFWYYHYDYTSEYGTTIRGGGTIKIVFRDEEDYLVALLMN